MTLPAVVGKWQKTVHINQMKHTYSVIANAFQMSMQDNGNPKEWYWGTDGSKENLTILIWIQKIQNSQINGINFT